MSKSDLASRLNWDNLLGFSNFSASRAVDSTSNVSAKVGSKEGLKPRDVSQLGAKIGNKPGMKPSGMSQLGAKIGGKIGMKPVVTLLGAKFGVKTGQKPNF